MTAEIKHSAPFLDTIWMRLIAALVAICGVLLFVAANQDFLSRAFAGSAGESGPYEACLNERMEAVERLAQEAGYTAKQRELAEIRAREFCRNQTDA